MPDLLFLVVVLVLLYVVYIQKKGNPVVMSKDIKMPCPENMTCGSKKYETFADMKEVPLMGLPSKKDPKNHGKEYLAQVADDMFDPTQQLAHQVYVTKRREAGDHTLQLWGVNDGKMGYSSNYKGIRPPRQFKIDPYSALSPDITDLRDYVNPEETRLI